MIFAEFRCTCGCERVTVEDPPNDAVQSIERWCRASRKIVKKIKLKADERHRLKKD